jgi:cytochrome c oxidase assembly protein subunit 11
MTNPMRTAMIASAMGFGMFGLAYASEPLYRMFCQVTGFGGTTQKREGETAPGAVAGKTMVIRFDANHTPDLAWDFAPEKTKQTVTVGERSLAFYTADNLANTPVTGRATFNVAPAQAGQYFVKTQCFCFTEQRLNPKQHARMPVTFFVDPKILTDPNTKDIEEITLSYTFSPLNTGSPVDAGKKRG